MTISKPLLAFLILTATMISGLNFPISKIGLTFASPFLLLSIRLIGAGLFMLPFIIRRTHPKNLNEWLKIAVIGLFQSALVLGCSFISLKTITASSVSILSSTNPIWTIVIGSLFLKMRYSRFQWLGVFIGFIGVFITLGLDFQIKVGTVFGLLSGMTWGIAILLVGRWGKTMDVWVMTAYQMLFGGVVTLIAGLFLEHPHIALTGSHFVTNIFILTWLIIMSSIVNFLTWFYVLQNYDAEKASSYLFLIPFFGVISGYFLLDESIRWYVIAGGALIGLGIYLVNRPPSTLHPKPPLAFTHQR